VFLKLEEKKLKDKEIMYPSKKSFAKVYIISHLILNVRL